MKTASLESIAIGNMLVLAQACAAARECRLSTISRLAHGDPTTLDKIRQGKASITLRKWEDTMKWLRDKANWPAGAVIPAVWEPWRDAPPRQRRKPAARSRTAA